MSNSEWFETICFLDGQAYSTKEDGTTLCIGSEQDIKAMLENPKIRCSSPIVNDIVDRERMARLEKYLLSLAKKD